MISRKHTAKMVYAKGVASPGTTQQLGLRGAIFNNDSVRQFSIR